MTLNLREKMNTVEESPKAHGKHAYVTLIGQKMELIRQPQMCEANP